MNTDWKIETKLIQAGYEPKMGSREYFLFIKAQPINMIVQNM